MKGWRPVVAHLAAEDLQQLAALGRSHGNLIKAFTGSEPSMASTARPKACTGHLQPKQEIMRHQLSSASGQAGAGALATLTGHSDLLMAVRPSCET
ncbi:MAG: hypothetical protein FRX49_06962 [Trebouxia sp. A1-2]|nr:MAG: hypothetical protein FRX49_06962 [Trebouxia sp. A1-2]